MNPLLPTPSVCLARDNPFAVQRVHTVRFEPQSFTWASLFARLESLAYRAAIVGPKGSGKTTLLEDLESPLQQRGFHTVRLRLNREQRQFPPGTISRLQQLGPGDIVLLDGAEQLSRLAWWNFRRATRLAGGLIVSAHRAGLLPTAVECRTSPELLHRIATQLLAADPDWLPSACQQLFAQHNGNLRLALRDLYDWHAGFPS